MITSELVLDKIERVFPTREEVKIEVCSRDERSVCSHEWIQYVGRVSRVVVKTSLFQSM